MCGSGRVWSIEPVAHRRALAGQMGADAVVDPAAVDPVRQILSDTGQRGVDVAIDCAARGGTINQCVNMARNGGRVVITGIPSETHVPLEYHPIRRKELTLFNVRRSNHESETALHLLGEQPKRFVPMLTHARPLEEVESMLTTLEHYADGVGKAVIQVG
jgi:L-iditol 2-dehydrogenase